jgi:predicted Zn-dependent protease with MMP-like domain
MVVKAVSRDQIIMNFSVPPSIEDVEVIVRSALQALPDELMELCDGLAIRVDDFPDEAIQHDLDLDDPYELLALYRSGSQIAPGVTKKTANDDDLLMVFRRPLLDAWCEACEDLGVLVRQVLIEELGQNFDFSEEDIEEMISRHFQGPL